MLASDLVIRLAAGGISASAARQRVSRSREPIRRLKDLRFPHNERFVFLKEHDKTAKYYKAFLSAADKTKSAYGVCLRALMGRGGICPLSIFEVLTGCPLNSNRHLSSGKVLHDLLDLGAIRSETLPGSAGSYVELNEEIRQPIGIKVMRANFVVENVAIEALRDWLKKLGFVSYNKAKIRGEFPNFANFRFDLVGPSYLRPLASLAKDGPQPGFVVADVHLGLEMVLPALGYFLRKTRIIRSPGTNRPFLALLLCDGFTSAAFHQGKAEGILLATPGALFGDDVAKALRDLIGVLVNVAEVATKTPDIVNDLFSRLSAIEGAAGNIRGPLFEFITAHVLTAKWGSSVDVGKVVTSSKLAKSAEIDVLQVLKGQDHVGVYECRGHAPGHVVPLADVEKWLCKSVPIIRYWLLEHPDFCNHRHTFNYWTTGSFAPDAITFLTSAKSETRKYNIDWLDGEGVLRQASSAHASAAVKALNEHYLRHPIAVRV
jgi:hypothetical protein